MMPEHRPRGPEERIQASLAEPTHASEPDCHGFELYQKARDQHINGHWGHLVLVIFIALPLWGVIEWAILTFAGRRWGYDARLIVAGLAAAFSAAGGVIALLHRYLGRLSGLHDTCPRCRGWLDVHPFLPECSKCGFRHYDDWRRHHRAEILDPGPVPVQSVRRLMVAEAALMLVLSGFALLAAEGSVVGIGLIAWEALCCAASFGLWLFWKPARILYVVSRAGALAVTPLMAPVIKASFRDSTGLVLILGGVAILLAAVITGLVWFTAMARAFEPEPSTGQPTR